MILFKIKLILILIIKLGFFKENHKEKSINNSSSRVHYKKLVFFSVENEPTA